jgi:hypothetical protein
MTRPPRSPIASLGSCGTALTSLATGRPKTPLLALAHMAYRLIYAFSHT